MHCWGAARRQVIIKLQQVINKRNPSTVALPRQHILTRNPPKKDHEEFKAASNKWELVCEAYLILGLADEEKYYPGRVAYDKAGESIRLVFKTAFETVNHVR